VVVVLVALIILVLVGPLILFLLRSAYHGGNQMG
jgi:hypothetical protein